MRAALILIAVAALASAAATARADVESALVKEGLAAYAELDYARAVALLERASGESLTREEKIVAYRTMGMAQVALDHSDLAKGYFQHLLRLDPSATLDRSVAPKVRAVFEQAKSEAATSALALSPALPLLSATLAPSVLQEGQPATVRVRYPGGVARRMTLFFRPSGQTPFARISVEGAADGRFSATVPGAAVRPPALEYHAVLVDDVGAAIAVLGSLGQPRSAAVTARRKPIYARGWFWGVLGGVAAAGAVAAGLAVGLPHANTTPVTINAL
jgi:hypothetical protein